MRNIEKVEIREWYVQEGDTSRSSNDKFTFKGAAVLNDRRKDVAEGVRESIADRFTAEILFDTSIPPKKKAKIIKALKNTPF